MKREENFLEYASTKIHEQHLAEVRKHLATKK